MPELTDFALPVMLHNPMVLALLIGVAVVIALVLVLQLIKVYGRYLLVAGGVLVVLVLAGALFQQGAASKEAAQAAEKAIAGQNIRSIGGTVTIIVAGAVVFLSIGGYVRVRRWLVDHKFLRESNSQDTALSHYPAHPGQYPTQMSPGQDNGSMMAMMMIMQQIQQFGQTMAAMQSQMAQMWLYVQGTALPPATPSQRRQSAGRAPSRWPATPAPPQSPVSFTPWSPPTQIPLWDDGSATAMPEATPSFAAGSDSGYHIIDAPEEPTSVPNVWALCEED